MNLEEKYFSQKASPKDIMDYFEINYFKARATHLNEDEHQYLMDTLLLIHPSFGHAGIRALGKRNHVEFTSFQ